MKKLTLWLAVFGLGLVTAYVTLIGIVSISTGLHHLHKDGAWMPIAAGGMSILVMTWLLYRTVRFLIHLSRRSGRLKM
jgi:hypothetical protein